MQATTVGLPSPKRARVEGGARVDAIAPAGGLDAAFSEDKGSRTAMEDVAVIELEGFAGTDPPAAVQHPTPPCRIAFVGVFDGHGGRRVAEHAAAHLHANVLAAGLGKEAERVGALAQQVQEREQQQAAGGGKETATGGQSATGTGTAGGAAAAAAAQGAKPLLPSVKTCKAAILEGFKATDAGILERCAADGWPDGCTVVAAWFVGELVLVANMGDARGVLARRQPAAAAAGAAAGEQAAAAGEQKEAAAGAANGSAAGAGAAPELKAITLTREHKAILAAERQRIEKAGSFVSADGRLAGRIEVSRALGDRQFKRSGMCAVPDIQAFQLGDRDAFLLLGCDGFWGVFPPQEAVDFAARELWDKGNGVKQACNRLIYEAVRERGCKDNCTVLLLRLGG